MPSIQFGASQTPLKPELLNHKTESPINKNQIQFYIGGDYLQNYTDQGIENFVKKHNGDLSVDEVKTFIQKIAQNAESVKGMSFDLTDPDIGLMKKDGIEVRHIAAAFTMDVHDREDVPEGLRAATDVRFVDAEVTFALKKNEETIASAQGSIKELNAELKELNSEHDSSLSQQSKITRGLKRRFDDPQAELSRVLERKNAIPQKISEIKLEIESMKTEQKELKPEDARYRDLTLMIRGAEAELKTLALESKDINEQMDSGWTKLSELESANRTLATQESKITELKGQIEDQIEIVRQASGAQTAPSDEIIAKDPDPAADTVVEDVEDSAIQSFLSLPPKQQASQLASKPEAERKALISQLSQEERTAIKSEVNTYIERLEDVSITKVRKEQRTKEYQTIIQELDTLPLASEAADEVVKPAAEESIPIQEKPATPVSKPASKPAGISLDDSGPPPADAITFNGKAMKLEGKVILKGDFVSLNAKQQFALLMDCDKTQVKDLLLSLGTGPEGKQRRANIKQYAQQIVSDYRGSHDMSGAAPAGLASYTRPSSDGSAYVNAPPNPDAPADIPGFSSSEYMSESYADRAQYILQVIREIDGDTQVSGPAQTVPVTASGRVEYDPTKHLKYAVKPGDTARSVTEELFGSPKRTQEIFILNPGLEESMRSRGKSNFHNEDISQYEDYKELILSRAALPDLVEHAP